MTQRKGCMMAVKFRFIYHINSRSFILHIIINNIDKNVLIAYNYNKTM